ncbi:dCTP deaminase domain-containing protein [Desulfosediminicola sp.]|uniref:dCTP deaminase domain-containing protein n=1 Tax=Desulfosediminicola sp. TaxID=2886825 RepID=UPI003AF23DAF
MSGKCIDLLSFAKTDKQAEMAYDLYRYLDPFPNIDSALLNAADIADYVAQTGMIYPFDHKRLGPASYEMVLGGETLYWDETKNQCGESNLGKNAPLVLKKNSITYVSVRETFRLPHYIAVRFNLRVGHVHRGLLLGTGPLVDPGFQGNLMIPIHNLTDNEYIIHEGKDLISVEFTKVSRNEKFLPQNQFEKNLVSPPRHGVFVKNSKKNSKKTFEQLLRKELPIGIGKVMSSLSGTLAETKMQLNEYESLINKVKKYSLIAILPIAIALITVYIDIKSYVADANKYVADATMVVRSNNESDFRSIVKNEDLVPLKKNIERIEQATKSISANENNLVSLSDFQTLKNDVDTLKETLFNLEKLILENQKEKSELSKDEKN